MKISDRKDTLTWWESIRSDLATASTGTRHNSVILSVLNMVDCKPWQHAVIQTRLSSDMATFSDMNWVELENCDIY